MVPYWDPSFDAADYRTALDALAEAPDEALSVYVHLPFCARRCYYCGCNAMATSRTDVVDAYLDRVEREVWRVAARIGLARRVTQLHWGGGTPNLLDRAQMIRLYGLLATAFHLDPDAEVSIEMDPRVGSPAQMRLLRELGFTRISLGVQDLDDGVQAAIGRLQSEADTVQLFEAARAEGFGSINLDLVYGLPRQSVDTVSRTVDRVVALRPDRVALFGYAHVPSARPHQRAIDEGALPDPGDRLALFLTALERLEGAGYTWLGLDHFVLHDDALARAARARRLQRNFMGYVDRRAPHTLAFGTSAIGSVAGRFVQAHAKLGPYQKAIDAGGLAVARGHTLSRDDRFRGAVIRHLMCNMEIDLDITVSGFGVPVDGELPAAVDRLAPYIDDGLLEPATRRFRVTRPGRFFLRTLATEFDRYARDTARQPVFSRVV
jgi:oxygen-independent coproporphyrinogen-3 oxidase